jgi:hypothetical protein
MRSGAALPAVLFAVAMTSALAVGGAYVARQLAASARFGQRGAELQTNAEASLVNTIATWDSARAGQQVGIEVPVTVQQAAAIRTDLWITRTGPTLYWLVAEASSGVKPVLRRRIGVLVSVANGTPRLVSDRAWSDLP